VQAVERAIAAAPADRAHSVAELESALQECLLVERPIPPLRRTAPARLAVGAAAVAVLAGVGWLLAPLVGSREGAGGSGAPGAAAAATSVTMRKLAARPAFSRPSNPSADGRFVAASANDGDAVLIDLSTGTARPLGVTHLEAGDDDGYASITVLSADARHVAVNWWQDGRGSLRVVSSDGTAARTLLAPAGDAQPYQWSRDGSMLLTAVVDADGVATIALVAVEDGAVRPIRRLQGWVNDLPESMSLSPDGRYIAYDYPETAISTERDIFIVDAHTGTELRLDAPPGHDTSPLWAPDGRTLVFFSDRSRSMAIWAVGVEHGRPQGAPRLLKDDLGRVRARGFAADGTLHVELTIGHPEVYISRLDASPDALTPLSPRQALGNFFPMWSPDGLRLAYTSERHDRNGRELWIFDTVSGRESQVETPEQVGRPIGWSPDGTRLLVSGNNNPRLSIVDRDSGRTSLVPECVPRAVWLPEGIACLGPKRVTLRDPRTGRALRVLDLGDPQITSVSLAADGRSVIAAHRNGSVVLQDVRTGGRREWSDPGVTSVERHVMAPHAADVAYLANRHDAGGESRAIMSWRGGDPRVLMTVRPPEAMAFEGWTADGSAVLATRWTSVPEDSQPTRVLRTLWRLPVNGTAPSPTRLTIEGLRDVSVHPDGLRVAFNAGWKKYESWVIEHLLATDPPPAGR
jgi:Tol biopolymer transport system component